MTKHLYSAIFSLLISLTALAQHDAKDSNPMRLGEYSPEPQYKGVNYFSQYVSMRDSVRLAVDVFLPKKLEEGKKLPTVVYFVRYVRSFQLKWFWRGLKNPAFGSVPENEVKFFTSHGYAVAIVDLRGSGASFGHREMEFSPQEVFDMGEILSWITAEPWSDGKTATTGVSYTGTTAELALSTKHPSLKACIPRSNIWDLYTDIIFPGGIRQSPFIKAWKITTNSLDQNSLAPFGKKVKTFVKGPSPVDGDKRGRLLKQAMAEHKNNFDIFGGLYRVSARNEPDKGYGSELSVDNYSIHSKMKIIESNNVPIFRISGWFDGALPNSVFKGFWNTSNTKRVLIGPWDHGPGQYFTNKTGNQKPKINVDLEILRFLDTHVKGLNTGMKNEPPIHYFEMGTQEWRTANVWPPKEVRSFEVYLQQNTMSATPSSRQDTLLYQCNYNTTTGRGTRWNSLDGMYRTGPTFYGPRNGQDSLMLVFDGAILEEDLRITGHPEVKLNVATSTGKGHVFVYLEEVLPDGTSRYITEGMLNLNFMQITQNPDYNCAFAQHSFKEMDVSQVKPNVFQTTSIDMIPTSYVIKKGSRLRLAVGVADKGHFDLPVERFRPESISIITGGTNGSFVRLPIRQLTN